MQGDKRMSESTGRRRRLRERAAGARLRAPERCDLPPGKPARPAQAAAFLLFSSFLAGGAGAQQLWSVREVSRAPDGPAVVTEGVRMSPDAGGALRIPQPAEAAEVQVTYDYLRLGMGYLELPLPDGSVIEAENAVFEDRGGGNLMWTGEVPGAGYESVLFTVQDGHLVGWFGEPGGPKYVVYAGPDGRGSLAVEVGPTGDWCGVEAGMGPDLVREVAAAGSRPASVASESGGDQLDILVLYPEETEHYWRVIGGPAVGIQQFSDYLNMVFRNGAIQATANLIPVRWDPRVASHPSTQGAHYSDDRRYSTPWHSEFLFSPEVETLRGRYKPDLVHFIPDVGTRFVAGLAALRTDLHPNVLTGWSTPHPFAFAHEIGHNLGGHHDPASFGSRFEEFQKGAFRPHGFGHTDMTSCTKHEGGGNFLQCPTTIMSFGTEAIRGSGTSPITEPFYSSVRLRPNGWTIGRPGTSEVERLLHETVPVAVRSGEEPWPAEQHPQKVVDAHWAGHDTARVLWSADWRSQEGGTVDVTLAEGANDYYSWSWDRHKSPENPPLDDRSGANVRPIVRAGGIQVGVEISGLRPGGRYRVSALGPGRSVDGEYIRPLSSDVFHLEPPGRASGSPTAPDNVGATVTGPDSVRVHWRGNARVETGYEVWYRKWSGGEPDEVWRRYGDPLQAGARYADLFGLAAEEVVQVKDYDSSPGEQEASIGRYSFVVVAYNEQGWSASETLHLEFMPGPYPEPRSRGRISDCYERPTGVTLDEYFVTACVETPDGARRRVWDYGLQADQSGLLYFFDRDNAEILVKVLDGCAINGYRWVFVAPVTTLPFRLVVHGPLIFGGRGSFRRSWYYDSERRSQDQILRLPRRFGNPKGRTARTVSDTTAFPCTAAEIAAAKATAAGSGSRTGFAAASGAPSAATRPARSLTRTDCEPDGPTLTLRGGYTVSMCYETYDGLVGDARDWGLDSSQSALMYFFERNNAEVLIKVLDGCGVNGHRWVFVAPVTDLAFNLVVTSPDGQRWTHGNRLGRTADAASDVSAFPCASSA